MPPKSKNAPKAKHQPTPSSSQPQAPPEPPATVAARTAARYAALWPVEQSKQQLGLHGLSGSERTSWANTHYLRAQANLKSLPLSNKAAKDLWKGFNEFGIPVRGLKQPEWCWGKDRVGRDIGSYRIEEFEERAGKKAQLTRLEVQGRGFKARREKENRLAGTAGGEVREELERLSEEDFEKERERRQTLAKLRMELYGQKTGSFALDPEWDDVIPIPQEEGEGALASIAYPEDYAEAMSYLRAVMASKEYTPRTLRLTETIINMNPAHYTVWLYRFSIVQALNISITDEITWLNGVSLTHLKNYQIWHHRQLLVDHLYASIAARHPNQDVTPASAQNNVELADLGKAEQAFLKRMLDEDAKNYHVWSYRQYLVRKLGLFEDGSEMSAVETLILEDVRNNSAWSHRFFLVFSNPANCSPSKGKGGELAIPVTKHDPACPSNVVDREIAYVQGKIELAPQNQSPWNYLRGILTRGGRPAVTQEGFIQQFVVGLGDGEDKEEVRSSHALDLLAEIWAETGQVEKADLALTRLGEKWDRIRAGYWEWRRRCIAEGVAAATTGGEGV